MRPSFDINHRTYLGELVDRSGPNSYATRVVVREEDKHLVDEEDRYSYLLLPFDDDGFHNHDTIEGNHNLTWGYGGSGPHDLAFSLLVDIFFEQGQAYHDPEQTTAFLLHRDLVTSHVARWPQNRSWRIEATELIAWARQQGFPEAGHDIRWTSASLRPLAPTFMPRFAADFLLDGRHFYAETAWVTEEGDTNQGVVTEIILCHEDEPRIVTAGSIHLDGPRLKRDIIDTAHRFDFLLDAQHTPAEAMP